MKKEIFLQLLARMTIDLERLIPFGISNYHLFRSIILNKELIKRGLSAAIIEDREYF